MPLRTNYLYGLVHCSTLIALFCLAKREICKYRLTKFVPFTNRFDPDLVNGVEYVSQINGGLYEQRLVVASIAIDMTGTIRYE